MTMLLRHLQIKGLNLILAKLKDCFINQFRVSSRLTGLDLIPKNLQSHCTRIVPANCGQQINMLSEVCTCAEINIYGRAQRFYFDYFRISVHSFIRDRKQLLMGGEGRGEVGFRCHPPFPLEVS